MVSQTGAPAQRARRVRYPARLASGGRWGTRPLAGSLAGGGARRDQRRVVNGGHLRVGHQEHREEEEGDEDTEADRRALHTVVVSGRSARTMVRSSRGLMGFSS